eukprot:scaffold253330_cov15-Tisochrysis_lutea.AAC.1
MAAPQLPIQVSEEQQETALTLLSDPNMPSWRGATPKYSACLLDDHLRDPVKGIARTTVDDLCQLHHFSHHGKPSTTRLSTGGHP